MDKFAKNIINLISSMDDYTYLLPVIGLFVSGILIAIPSSKTREFGTKAFPWIMLGTILVAGAVDIGKNLASKISF